MRSLLCACMLIGALAVPSLEAGAEDLEELSVVDSPDTLGVNPALIPRTEKPSAKSEAAGTAKEALRQATSNIEHVKEMLDLESPPEVDPTRPWRHEPQHIEDVEGTHASRIADRSRAAWAEDAREEDADEGLPELVPGDESMHSVGPNIGDAAETSEEAEEDEKKRADILVKAGLRGEAAYAALTADAKAEAKVTNPNKEPVALMIQGLARLDAQAKHMAAGTKEVLKDYAQVLEGKITAAEVSERYASTKLALGKMAADMDPTADKCSNLYQYACGGFLKRHAVPKAKKFFAHSRTFSTIMLRNHILQQEIVTNVPHEKRLATALAAQNKTLPKGTTIPASADAKYPESSLSSTRKAVFRQYYKACIDTAGQDKRGTKDANYQHILQQITGAKDTASLLKVLGEKEVSGLGLAPLTIDIGIDDKDRSKYTAYVQQPLLSLPDPAFYYVKKGAVKLIDQVKAKYLALIGTVFKLAGYEGDAEKVLAFETRMAMKMLSKQALRNPYIAYNPTTFDAFAKRFPAIQPFFDAIATSHPKLSGPNKLVVSTTAYLVQLEKMLTAGTKETAALSELKDYAVWCLLRSVGTLLGSKLSAALFGFFGTYLKGIKKKKFSKALTHKIQVKRCQMETVKEFWGYVDRMYVERTYGKTAQVQMEVMMTSIKASFKKKLEDNNWMDIFTKKAAIEKLAEMNYKIGAPTRWPDYPFQTGAEHLANRLAMKKHSAALSIALYMQGVDNTKWGMNPSQVNAYYSMLKNEMVFPAGILQPPFFSPNQPMVVNYASIGSVMGHELSHGFDNSGAKYDKFGKYRDWWTRRTASTFKRKAQCFKKAYSKIEVGAAKLKVNGNKTIGENIADNGGVGVSNSAYSSYAAQYGAPTLFKLGQEDVTADLLFWIGWGQAWCKSQSPLALKHQVLADVHAPSKARVNGVAMNSVAFAVAAGCAPGAPMNPPASAKCNLW